MERIISIILKYVRGYLIILVLSCFAALWTEFVIHWFFPRLTLPHPSVLVTAVVIFVTIWIAAGKISEYIPKPQTPDLLKGLLAGAVLIAIGIDAIAYGEEVEIGAMIIVLGVVAFLLLTFSRKNGNALAR